MLKIALKFDEFLLDSAEAIAHRFQMWTGKTNFFLAKLSAAIFCVAALVSLIEKIAAHAPFGLYLLNKYYDVVFSLGGMVWYYDSEEYQAVRRFSEGVKNPTRVDPFWRATRIVLTSLILYINLAALTIDASSYLFDFKLQSTEAFTPFMNILVICWLYWIACDPLPPSSGKIRNWLMRLLGKTSTAEASN